jgi:transposase-like protein
MYTVIEAAYKLGVSENTLRNWIRNQEVDVQIEVRRNKPVQVISPEEVMRLMNIKGIDDQPQVEEQSVPQPESYALAIAYVREEITRRDNKIDELYDRIAQLEREKGQVEGEKAQLRSQLESTLEEVKEWRRENMDAVKHHRLPWWKKIIGVSK